MLYRKYIKRLLDIILSLIGLPFFLLIFLVLAPMIWLEDHGPIFYNANRLGMDGKFFKMYKFRSMRVNAPDLRNADGSTYNASDDPRVTKIGRFIRKTSLDETPQLLNVLKGDMSFVGPRARLTTRYRGYEYLTERAKQRLSVRPGITGYSQAYFRNSATSEEKEEQDAYYVDHMSFVFDVKILIQTFLSVVKSENIYCGEDEKKTYVHEHVGSGTQN